MKSAVIKYEFRPRTPELVTNFWQTFLETSIKGQGLEIPAPVILCDRTSEELEALREKGRMWVPKTELTYLQLGQIFPKVRHVVREDSPITDEFKQDTRGVDVETDLDAPNRGFTQKELRKIFESQGRRGMRLSTFILASQASKVLTGHYLDEETWSWLLGSRDGDHVLGVHSPRSGSLFVSWRLLPKGRASDVGGRSEGVKEA